MLRYQFILAAIFLGFQAVHAQPSHSDSRDPGHLTCDQYDMTQAFFAEHPEVVPMAEEADAQLEAFTETYANSEMKSDEVIIIPVVFHVVHLGGEENISDDQIYSAIDVLNEDFSAQTPGLGDVIEEFSGIIGDAGVEFRLARRDPQGNCTNGINRVFSDETLDGSASSLKQQISSWGRSKYLNVWVVKQIGSGAAGFAYRPNAVNDPFWGAPRDGIVILHDYVGRIGTSTAGRSHALSHEVGHWANLKHTWGDSNSPADPANCTMDDNVADTPKTIGWQTCDLDGITCGTLDNVQNFMDYSYCYRMFTEGQKTRLRAALNSGVAQRSNLHTQANLIETGVLEEDQICLADFTTDREPEICAGTTLDFTDLSYHNPTEWFWTFEGGEPAVSEAENPSVLYDTPGVYNVSLTVSTPLDGESVTKEGYVTVLPEAMEPLPYSESFETIDVLDGTQGWLDHNPDNGQHYWKLSNEAGFSDNSSVYVRGRHNPDNTMEVLTSPTYDLSGLTQQPVVTFKYAHVRRSSLTDDRLRVYISQDCGQTWIIRVDEGGDDLPTVDGNVFDEFVPTNPNHWREVQIGFVMPNFFTDQFRLKFEFTSYQGNNIYVDDINITGIDAVDNIEGLNALRLYPNPARDFATLELDFDRATTLDVDLMDMTGRVVGGVLHGHRATGNVRVEVPTHNLASGVYLLRIRTDSRLRMERLVVE